MLRRIHVLQVERYAVDIWNSVVKKQAGKHVTVLANAKCKLEVKCYYVPPSLGVGFAQIQYCEEAVRGNLK